MRVLKGTQVSSSPDDSRARACGHGHELISDGCGLGLSSRGGLYLCVCVVVVVVALTALQQEPTRKAVKSTSHDCLSCSTPYSVEKPLFSSSSNDLYARARAPRTARHHRHT